MTLVVPFDEATPAPPPPPPPTRLSSGGRITAPAALPLATAGAGGSAGAAGGAAAAVDVVGVLNSGGSVTINNGGGSVGGDGDDATAVVFRGMDPASVEATVAAAEDAARETGLALEHARVALAAAARAEAAAARTAVAAEATASAAHQAAAATAAATAAAAANAVARRGGGVGSELSFGGSDDISNSRSSESATFSGGGAFPDATAISGAGGHGIKGLQHAGGGGGGSPLEISFLTPTYGRATAAIPATSYGSGDSETMTPAELEAMMSRLSSRRHGNAVDTPGPSIAIQRQPPLSWLDEPAQPARRQEQQQAALQQSGRRHVNQPRLLPHHLAPSPDGNKGGLGRGGWRGGDAPATATASASSSSSSAVPAPLLEAAGRRLPPVGAGVGAIGRRLSSARGLARIGEALSWGRSGGASPSGRAAAAAAAAAGEAGESGEAAEGQDEAEWVRSLLFSGAGTPGLVVDLWSPGAIFIRHVEVGGLKLDTLAAFVTLLCLCLASLCPGQAQRTCAKKGPCAVLRRPERICAACGADTSSDRNANKHIHLQEFGDAGCMDAAYALGLWRAGSSFEVVEGTALSSTAPAPSTAQVTKTRTSVPRYQSTVCDCTLSRGSDLFPEKDSADRDLCRERGKIGLTSQQGAIACRSEETRPIYRCIQNARRRHVREIKPGRC